MRALERTRIQGKAIGDTRIFAAFENAALACRRVPFDKWWRRAVAFAKLPTRRPA